MILKWCILCVNVCLFSTVCRVSFSGCVCEYSFPSIFGFAFLYAFASRIIDDVLEIILNSNKKSRYIFLISNNRVSTVIDHFNFFRDHWSSNCFVIWRRSNHSFLYVDSDELLLMRSQNQKPKLRQDSKLRWVFVMIFEFLKDQDYDNTNYHYEF